MIIVVNMFISLINETYDHVKKAKLYEYDAELLEYTWKKVKGVVDIIGLFKPNHKGRLFIL